MERGSKWRGLEAVPLSPSAMDMEPSAIRAHLRLIASESRIGRIRRCVRRCFIVSNGRPISASDVIERAFPRIRRVQDWHRWSARRALLKEATIIARSRYGRGRPNLWLPNSNIGTKEDKT
jgi:hypothetical protein